MIEIKENHDRLAVFIDGKIDNHGFMTAEDALHSVWCDNGKVAEDWYRVDANGVVSLEVKTPLNE